MENEEIEALVQNRLQENRTLLLGDDIDWEQSNELCRKMLVMECQSNEPINLVINSSGGELYAALQACDIMEHVLASPVHGLVLGQCSSAATFILLHCTKRSCTPHSRFLIHSGTTNTSFRIDDTSEKNLQRLLQECRQDREMVIDLYKRKLGIKQKKVEMLLARGDREFGEYLSSSEALDLGLVQEVIEGKVSFLSK